MDRADVIIFGGGLVGLALASALDSSGLSIILVDPADPAQRTGAAFDGRSLYLVAHAGSKILRFDVRSPSAVPTLPGFYGSFF